MTRLALRPSIALGAALLAGIASAACGPLFVDSCAFAQHAGGEAQIEHAGHDAAAGQPGAHDDDATIRHSFADVEKWVRAFDDPSRAAWQMPDSIAGSLGLAPGKVILDIGAGTGYFNESFAARVRPGGKVFSADVEPGLVAHMLERAETEATPEVFPLLIPMNAPRVPEPVDVVFICDTYHHIDDRIEYFTKVRDILKPGGVVVVVDFKMTEIPVGPPVEHRLSPDRVREEMDEAGFEPAREETFLPYQYFLVFRLKQP